MIFAGSCAMILLEKLYFVTRSAPASPVASVAARDVFGALMACRINRSDAPRSICGFDAASVNPNGNKKIEILHLRRDYMCQKQKND